ncbi:neutral zinc metallopeptidase [Noviherbaspirillum sedimenti]|uniref:Metalloprotease n=1 Tax=Noviherbaspirillum sedimenti TaxID=2320865 RepID=A0A3A3G0D7_9BURK|nr:neutral zinc metallopeptidase [Noviherbaspirillum sedimenti]RJG01918.1 metalloprotease [Noviherbaspirillum sedimenti]
MKWEGNRESDNVEDRRGSGGGGFGGRSIGLGTIAIALVASYFLGINPLTVIEMMSGGNVTSVQQAQTPAGAPANDTETRFVRTVLADTEDTWSALFRNSDATYAPPTLVLFAGATPTACGTGQSASGPFYCPADQKLYIDLSFFQLMRERFQVNSEFAQAYVIAHEIGHHVQHLTGIDEQVRRAQGRMSQVQANNLSVRTELQADCYAGVWAHHANQARGIIEQGDVEGALRAATAIGDDALQRQSQGHVVPDSFTHGSSAQRTRWFSLGLERGRIEDCDTFKARQL